MKRTKAICAAIATFSLILFSIAGCASNLSAEYNSKAFKLYREGKYKEAIESYDKAISINPNYADAYYNRGIAKYSLEDYAGAIADWEHAISLAPANKEKLQPLIDEARKKLSEQKWQKFTFMRK